MRQNIKPFLIIITILILLPSVVVNRVSAYTDRENEREKNETQIINTEKNQNENKNKFQLRVNNSKNVFFIKGVVTNFSSNKITIKDKEINIDSNITKEFKIVGNPIIGSYAKVQGIIEENDNKLTYFATKIVIDQRNKHDIDDDNNQEAENEDDDISPTPIVSPTISLTPTPIGTQSANFQFTEDLGKLIERIKNFLNLLTSFASTI